MKPGGRSSAGTTAGRGGGARCGDCLKQPPRRLLVGQVRWRAARRRDRCVGRGGIHGDDYARLGFCLGLALLRPASPLRISLRVCASGTPVPSLYFAANQRCRHKSRTPASNSNHGLSSASCIASGGVGRGVACGRVAAAAGGGRAALERAAQPNLDRLPHASMRRSYIGQYSYD
jgi:hypothetical protein